MTSRDFKHHFVLDCQDFSIAQWIERCTSFGFDSRCGFGLFCFNGFSSDGVNNRVREDSRNKMKYSCDMGLCSCSKTDLKAIMPLTAK